MIRLLPIWNWTHLANAKCLMSNPELSKKGSDVFRSLNEKDCRACEHFSKENIS